jgi:hypothetical protein
MTTLTKSKKKTLKELEDVLSKGYFNLELSLNLPMEYKDRTDLTYVEEYSFNIYYNPHDEDDDYKIKVATGSFKIFNTSQVINDEECPITAFDSSRENCYIYTSFYEYDTCEFNEEFVELNDLTDCIGTNIAHINTLEIIPEFRGKALGHLFLTKICDWLNSKVDLLIFKSFPLQYQGQGELSDSELEKFDTAKKKLNDYYTSMGFQKVKFPKDQKQDETYFFHQMERVLKGKYNF